MEIVNAISKVRWASTGPQHIHLVRGNSLRVELLCMEAGQKSLPATGPCAYYVVAGSAELAAGGKPHPLPAGQLAELGPGEGHTVANAGPGRLICLMIRAAE